MDVDLSISSAETLEAGESRRNEDFFLSSHVAVK